MKSTVTFTHLVTGKGITLARKSNNQFPVAAIFHGHIKDKAGKDAPSENVWLVLENVPNPLPVKESEQEVLKLLEINTQE